MANRYWVGGTGNWSDTARWSSTSGGAGGASVPTSADDVFFDANSGTGTATLVSSSHQVRNLVTTGYTGTINAGATGGIDIYGPTLTYSGSFTSSGNISFRILGTGVTTTATVGKTVGDFQVILGASLILASSLTGTNLLVFNTTGSINLGGNAISFPRLTFSHGLTTTYSNFPASISISQVLTIQGRGAGSGTFTAPTTLNPTSVATVALDLTNLSGFNATLPSTAGSWSITNPSNVTLTGVPSTLTAATSAGVFISGIVPRTFNVGAAGSSITFNASSATVNVTASSATINGTSGSGKTLTVSSSCTLLTLNSDLTVSTLTIAGPAGRTTVQSSSSGTKRILTATSYSLSNIAWKDIEAAGTIPFTGTGFLDLGNNLNITFPAGGSGLFFGSNF